MKKTTIQERQLLESYEDVDNETIQKGIKAFDNIFEARDRMIAIANANPNPKRKKNRAVGGKNAV